jgi:L-lactate dehydrogenase (cytochrome)/(S)-mandelate dehydrogenase
LSIELFGHKLSMPVMIGPTGLAGLMWPEGEQAAARAAASAGTGYCLSHGSVCKLEDVTRSGTSPRWMQVFIYRDRGFTEELANRAAAAGYDALVLTTDNQVLGNRERDVRNGFSIPPKFKMMDMLAMAGKLSWLWRMRPELQRITFGNYVRSGEMIDIGSLAKRMSELLDPSMSWKDVVWLRKIWKGPLLIKGILHPDEAKLAVKHGVDGVIVSNHGGRQLDGAVPALEALPDIVEMVNGRIPVLVDGGFRRGSHVVKALCLGAACCLVARPQLWGLAVGGEAGVAHVLDIFHREIDRSMALLGASRIADLTADLMTGPARSSILQGKRHAKFSNH